MAEAGIGFGQERLFVERARDGERLFVLRRRTGELTLVMQGVAQMLQRIGDFPFLSDLAAEHHRFLARPFSRSTRRPVAPAPGTGCRASARPSSCRRFRATSPAPLRTASGRGRGLRAVTGGWPCCRGCWRSAPSCRSRARSPATAHSASWRPSKSPCCRRMMPMLLSVTAMPLLSIDLAKRDQRLLEQLSRLGQASEPHQRVGLVALHNGHARLRCRSPETPQMPVRTRPAMRSYLPAACAQRPCGSVCRRRRRDRPPWRRFSVPPRAAPCACPAGQDRQTRPAARCAPAPAAPARRARVLSAPPDRRRPVVDWSRRAHRPLVLRPVRFWDRPAAPAAACGAFQSWPTRLSRGPPWSAPTRDEDRSRRCRERTRRASGKSRWLAPVRGSSRGIALRSRDVLRRDSCPESSNARFAASLALASKPRADQAAASAA